MLKLKETIKGIKGSWFLIVGGSAYLLIGVILAIIIMEAVASVFGPYFYTMSYPVLINIIKYVASQLLILPVAFLVVGSLALLAAIKKSDRFYLLSLISNLVLIVTLVYICVSLVSINPYVILEFVIGVTIIVGNILDCKKEKTKRILIGLSIFAAFIVAIIMGWHLFYLVNLQQQVGFAFFIGYNTEFLSILSAIFFSIALLMINLPESEEQNIYGVTIALTSILLAISVLVISDYGLGYRL